QRLRMLESDLGDELAGREVAAALELEQEALGADHGARVEAVGQDVVGHGQLSVHGEERSGIAERYGRGGWAASVMAMDESGWPGRRQLPAVSSPRPPGAAAGTPSRPRRTGGRASGGERPAVAGPSPTGRAARGRRAEGHRTSDRGRGGTYAQAIEYARARPWRRGVASTARS